MPMPKLKPNIVPTNLTAIFYEKYSLLELNHNYPNLTPVIVRYRRMRGILLGGLVEHTGLRFCFSCALGSGSKHAKIIH